MKLETTLWMMLSRWKKKKGEVVESGLAFGSPQRFYSSTAERLFYLYRQALARSNFIDYPSQSKEFRRIFVISGLKALFLLIISNFPLQNCIFRCETPGFGVCTVGPFPKTRANNPSGVRS